MSVMMQKNWNSHTLLVGMKNVITTAGNFQFLIKLITLTTEPNNQTSGYYPRVMKEKLKT